MTHLHHNEAHQHGNAHGHDLARPNEGGVHDPVCGMTVDPKATPHRHEHEGRTYYFYSGGCLAKFVAEPQKYLSKSAASAPSVPAGTIYTCPMHPEIRQNGPGSCPICGMALEPVVATLVATPNAELIDMSPPVMDRARFVAAGRRP